MQSMTAVNFALMKTIIPTPTRTVANALNPSDNSRVRDSPTIDESEPRREMISPTPRTPTSGVVSEELFREKAELRAERLVLFRVVTSESAFWRISSAPSPSGCVSAASIASLAPLILEDATIFLVVPSSAIGVTLVPIISNLAMSSLRVLEYASTLNFCTILCPAMRMRMLRPVLAKAPIAKMVARAAAATGRETGKEAEPGEVKRSMMRPKVNGTERDTAEETASCNLALTALARVA